MLYFSVPLGNGPKISGYMMVVGGGQEDTCSIMDS